MKVYLETLGCRLNFSEMETLARSLIAAGHVVVPTAGEAEVCVLNTCAVTHDAARGSRQATRALARANPAARLMVTGCYAELEAAEVRMLPQVRWVVGNRDKERLLALLEEGADLQSSSSSQDGRVSVPAFPLSTDSAPFPFSRTRAFIKVQDGCNNHCTFCIVTVARGRERSRPLEAVASEVAALAETGVQEAVLTGVHLGGYGRDLGTNLHALAAALLAKTPIRRLRLSSLEPFDLDTDFFDLWADPRLCPHLHLPLQSGCDATLQRMARRCSTAQFAHLAETARARIPDLVLTTDVIVGCPGESDDEFAQSLAFVETMEFAHVHVFPYSLRAGTAAARLPGHLPAEVKRERNAAMREMDVRSGRAVRRRFLGQTRPVLWEGQGQPAMGEEGLVWSGLTDNYLRVLAVAPQGVNLHNVVTPARLLHLEDDALWAKIPGMENAT
ncbi:MAG: tRNA (N(6)-L-threonylcarbamoyladenosine(37)-C(2))-methylthiotransferase MtaB [Anaerolineae bacterium]|nr:tRNA (N(6)-L-threonylcarbamoyladenosine(37)-C(2))-methylthiotransferase MtaB [Anaerolineae bacterium]